MKTCTKCGLEQDDSAFCKDRSRNDGLFPQCKTCCKQYRQTEHSKSLRRTWMLEYQKTPNGKLNSARTRKRYQQTERGRLVYQQAARRRLARKRLVAMALSTEDITVVYGRFHDVCFNCGTPERLEIDHNYPLSEGHGLTLDNAVLLCRSCNASKSDRLPEQFYSPEQQERLKAILGFG